MNEKVIALAVAGALAPAIAMADESTVTVYGKISVGIETAKAEGATNPAQDIKNRARVTEQASHIGFRGVEPLGGGLSAFFQVESLVKPDSAPGRVTSTAANTWANRNSGVGLRGGFGEILLGRWDVYYTNHIPSGDTLFVKSSYTATILALFGGTSSMGGLATTLTPLAGAVPPNAEGRGAVDAGGHL